jgi:hypothetical protein
MSACPKCGLNDKVQKVTSIVTSGTTTGTVTYYDNAMYQTTTGLAQRLMPPREPTIDRPGFCSLILLLLFLGWSIYVLIWLLVMSQTQNAQTVQLQALLGVAVIFGVIGGPGLIFAVIVLVSRKKTAERGKEQEEQLPVWRAAIERWNRLYNCFRCDAVHVEGERDWANPEGMNTILIDARNEQSSPQKLTAVTSRTSTVTATIESDAQGRWRCSVCKGHVRKDATSCKHCSRRFAR